MGSIYSRQADAGACVQIADNPSLIAMIVVAPLFDLAMRLLAQHSGWLRSYLRRWVVYGVVLAFSLAALRLRWPTSMVNMAIAAAFLILLPDMINGLTLGHAGSWFRKLRHRFWWTLAYGAAFAAIVAPRLGWPPAFSLAAGAFAFVVGTALISITLFDSRAGIS